MEVMVFASNSIISFTVEIKAVEKSIEKALHSTFVVESSHPTPCPLLAGPREEGREGDRRGEPQGLLRRLR